MGETLTIDEAGEPDHLSAVRVLAVAVDAREVTMRHHSQAVADLVWVLARKMGLAEDRAELLRLVAQVHDVGKIAVPDEVLRKPGKLSESEWTVMRDHPVLGEKIVRAAGLGDAARWIRAHHERWDGTGYPDGLRAAQIPVESRILAVCDAFDAMTSNRPYRHGLTVLNAIHEVDRAKGTQFDPEIAEMFTHMAYERFSVQPAS
jgi:HD-GYP domain-containing protein (c-di-GMP phosphodiesterase class II)